MTVDRSEDLLADYEEAPLNSRFAKRGVAISQGDGEPAPLSAGSSYGLAKSPLA